MIEDLGNDGDYKENVESASSVTLKDDNEMGEEESEA
jgi:hypothetical protein